VATAFIALGGNLGDRSGYLRGAVAGLRAAGVQVAAVSPVFETEAVADWPQPRYLNAVVRVETALAPRALLSLCLDIERRLGRVRPPGADKAPRTIDLDLLLYDGAVLAEPGLTVPHPRLLERPFVRAPLARVAPAGLRHPVTGDPLDHFPPHAEVTEIADPIG
jgi:2-amino-4-hydroxy-6-hydroxymethyldihydropteridine diphosphokinase